MTVLVEQITAGYDEFPRYDLTDHEIQNATANFLAAEGADLPHGRFVGVAVNSYSPLANVGRTTEQRVFGETFEGNDVPFMHREYGEYEDTSSFLMVIDRKHLAVSGVMRVIHDSEAGLKSMKDAAAQLGKTEAEIREYHDIEEGDKVVDIATLAVPKEYRGNTFTGVQSSLMLHRMFNETSVHDEVDHAVAIVDEKALRAIRAIGVPMVNMCGTDQPFSYLDSAKSYAVHARVPELQPGVERRGQELTEQTPFNLRTIRELGVKRFIRRRLLARAATNLASGKGLDEHIAFPYAA